MMSRLCNSSIGWLFGVLALGALMVAGTGCTPIEHHHPNLRAPVPPNMPEEKCKVVLPTYVIEPPDVLVIDAIHVVPKSPYHLKPFDVLAVQVQNTLMDAPISGLYSIDPSGLVKLGFRYGAVRVTGLTTDQAEEAVTRHLEQFLKTPVVSVTLAQIAAGQQITGLHLVKPDGTVTLGTYGSVSVVGMNIAQAKAAVERHLSQNLEDPEVSLDVYAYNSKVYYVVTQGAGLGDGIFRFPVTGNETVLDAISQVNGLQQVSSKKIWIARPTDEPGKAQVLPVHYDEITAMASAGTNYQVLPGDRVFIAENKYIALDNAMAKFIAPIERAMGFSLLGVGTVTRFSGHVLKGGGNPQSQF